MASDAGYQVEISGLPSTDPAPADLQPRAWVGVRFDCCGVYTRIYKNADGTGYVGRCPKCGRNVRLRVGPGGTSSRFFVAE